LVNVLVNTFHELLKRFDGVSGIAHVNRVVLSNISPVEWPVIFIITDSGTPDFRMYHKIIIMNAFRNQVQDSI